MVVPEGLEPPTPTLGMWRSILLSYGTRAADIMRAQAPVQPGLHHQNALDRR